MLLAAGLGTRLRPLTDERPKALVPVGDRPVLFHALEALERAGFERIAVNAHHEKEAVAAAVRGRAAVSMERELLGTAGGIARARQGGLVRGDVLVWNTDMFGAFDLEALVCAHRDADATLLVAPAQDGNVGIGEDGRVVRLRRSSFGKEVASASFLGLHVLGASLELPARGCIVGDVYIPALARGRTLRVVCTRTPFFDVGTLSGYLAANRGWLDARGLSSWVGEGAEVSCALEHSIVGDRGRASGQGSLVGCVVWPGAVARAPLVGAVITQRGVVAL
jgi:mannose-1-phosphate guanylyltransferase